MKASDKELEIGNLVFVSSDMCESMGIIIQEVSLVYDEELNYKSWYVYTKSGIIASPDMYIARV